MEWCLYIMRVNIGDYVYHSNIKCVCLLACQARAVESVPKVFFIDTGRIII